MIIINVAKDFSETPGGRLISEGPYSGELFREDVLKPRYDEAIANSDKLQINMDGCFGFPSSFIEESFGGLVRTLNGTDILACIEFISNDQPSLVDYIHKCVQEAMGAV